MKKITIIGIQGLPAQYGGFETLVENIIGENSPKDIAYTVFCSSKDYKTRPSTYKGVRLVYVPIHANGIQSTPYDIVSMLKAIRRHDVMLILGTSGCMFLPVLRLLYRKKIIVNIDGLEHRRAKWGKFAKQFLRISEKMAVKFSNIIIVDNKGIQDYVTETYQKESVLIAYGGDHVLQEITEQEQITLLSSYKLTPRNYSLTICRIEPENNCHVTLEAFAQTENQLVFIGNWNKSIYGKELKEKYSQVKNILILDAIYDLTILYTLRNNCKFYIHGHSAGGTNPSLVEAMFFGRPIVAYDVCYNRETTENKATYFKTENQLIELTNSDETQLCENGTSMQKIAHNKYKWSTIAKLYEQLY